jgi:hypothetical protein
MSESPWRAMFVPFMRDSTVAERHLIRRLFRVEMKVARMLHPTSDRAFVRFIARANVGQFAYCLHMDRQ